MSCRDGSAQATHSPLRCNRQLKLFRFAEVLVPEHALQPWPLRCSIRDQYGVYMCASRSGRMVGGSSEVKCCAEEFVLEQHCSATRTGIGVTNKCSLWSSSLRSLVSQSPLNEQLILQPQHSCMASENFTAQFFPNNEFTLFGGDADTEAGVSLSWPSVTCSKGSKPTRFFMELAHKQDTLIVTAHGHLLGRSPSKVSSQLFGVSYTSNMKIALGNCAWHLDHHGDNTYSIRHSDTQMQLYVDRDGLPLLDGKHEVVYPDQRMMFTVKLTWVGSDVQTADAPKVEGFTGLSEKDRVLGFTIQTLYRVNGRHMMLSALPDGHITLIHVNKPTRWELFTVADLKVRYQQ